jgi:Putative regulator of cell autolysis
MSRRVVWLQLLIGWLPVWALFTTLILVAHADTTVHQALLLGGRSILSAAVLGIAVQKLTERFPWPGHVTVQFVTLHLVAALIYGVSWIVLNNVIESIIHRALIIVIGIGIGPYIITGVWIYAMIAGVSYAAQATERASRAEAVAAQSQLAALRSQLNPHFLFNALHTIVQLIPREPRVAAQAAEQLAGLLRTTIEEDRDTVAMSEELAFVERYLDIERIRFGDRLRVSVDVAADVSDASLPSFAVQTLVENAVRHGASPVVEPTDIIIAAQIINGKLILTVSDNGAGMPESPDKSGTGLRRLRERLAVLYGNRASLDLTRVEPRGTRATLRIPQEPTD